MARPIKNTAQELKEFNKASAELVEVLNDLAKVLGDNAKEASKFTGDSAKNYKETFNDAISLGRTLSGYTADQLKSRREETKFLKDLNKLQQEQARVQSKIATLQDRLVTAPKEQQKYIQKSLDTLRDVETTLDASVDNAQNLKKTFEDISKQSKFFDELSDLVREVPVLSNVFGEFQKASDAARDAAKDGKNGFAAGAKQLGGVFTKFLAAFTIGKIVQGLVDFDERSVSIGRNLNRSAEESDKIVKHFNKVGRATKGITGAELQKAATDLSTAFGTTGLVAASTAKTLATQTKFLGMSTEEANSLAVFAAGTNQDYSEMVASMTGEIEIASKRNKLGIDYKAVTKDIAKTSNATKLLIIGQGKSLAAAGVEAKKLGATIDEIAAAGKNMLDFEESIAAELEAELLTGKEINNEKARMAAMMGNQEGLAKALQEDQALQRFEAAKTVFEADAIARAYGMSAEQMAKMSVEAKALKAFGASDKTELEASVKKEIERIDLLKKQGKEQDAIKAMKALQDKLGNDELIRQQQNLTMAETQAEAMQKMAEGMDKLHKLIEPISAFFRMIADNINIIVKGLLLITGNSLLGKLSKTIGGVSSVASKAGEAVSTAAGSAAGSAAGKAASKAGGSVAGKVGQEATETAAKGGKGFFGNLMAKAKSAVSSLNPITALKNSVKGFGGIGGFLKTALKKIPGLNTILTGFFAYNDIMSLLADPTDEKGNPMTPKQVNQQIGKILAGGLGSILGGAIGTAVGGPVGALIGSLGGEWLFKNIMGSYPEAAEALGEATKPIFESSEGKKKTEVPLKDFVLKPLEKDTITMAGGTKLGGNVEELLKELIVAVKQGQNIYIGANKLNESIGLNLHSVG